MQTKHILVKPVSVSMKLQKWLYKTAKKRKSEEAFLKLSVLYKTEKYTNVMLYHINQWYFIFYFWTLTFAYFSVVSNWSTNIAFIFTAFIATFVDISSKSSLKCMFYSFCFHLFNYYGFIMIKIKYSQLY